MVLKVLPHRLTVCKVADISAIDLSCPLCFAAKTDEEVSLVCPAEHVPTETLEREDGWRAFRIEGVLDFSLIGILARISSVLAENQIGIFVVSTFNTDYILIKEENLSKGLKALKTGGYSISE
ncbi:MAG: ACT domain-containing protein [Clostridiales bacterium]|nr:ACT domain-containing protein [Clostridiales bacterium]